MVEFHLLSQFHDSLTLLPSIYTVIHENTPHTPSHVTPLLISNYSLTGIAAALQYVIGSLGCRLVAIQERVGRMGISLNEDPPG